MTDNQINNTVNGKLCGASYYQTSFNGITLFVPSSVTAEYGNGKLILDFSDATAEEKEYVIKQMEFKNDNQ